MKNNIEKTFEQSVMGRNFSTKINNLEEEIRKVEKTERVRLYNIRQEWATKNHIYLEGKEYHDRYNADEKKVSEVSKSLREQLSVLQSEKNLALETMKNDESWKGLVHRKATPLILEQLENQGMTEVQLVEKLKGAVDGNVYSQYCYPLFYMEQLGWIKREGSGKIGDQRVCTLTALGKNQFAHFKAHKTFDYGLQ